MEATCTSSWTTVMVETSTRRSMIRGADSFLKNRSLSSYYKIDVCGMCTVCVVGDSQLCWGGRVS